MRAAFCSFSNRPSAGEKKKHKNRCNWGKVTKDLCRLLAVCRAASLSANRPKWQHVTEPFVAKEALDWSHHRVVCPFGFLSPLRSGSSTLLNGAAKWKSLSIIFAQVIPFQNNHLISLEPGANLSWLVQTLKYFQILIYSLLIIYIWIVSPHNECPFRSLEIGPFNKQIYLQNGNCDVTRTGSNRGYDVTARAPTHTLVWRMKTHLLIVSLSSSALI